jgi:hypothetical protein
VGRGAAAFSKGSKSERIAIHLGFITPDSAAGANAPQSDPCTERMGVSNEWKRIAKISDDIEI